MNTAENLLENSPLAMATTEGPGHILSFANAAFRDLHGKRADEILGHPITEVISSGDSVDVKAILDRVQGGDKFAFATPPRSSERGRPRGPMAYTAWGIPERDDQAGGLVIQVTSAIDPVDNRDPDPAVREIQELNREIRLINEKLVLSAIQQQTLAALSADSESRFRNLVQGLNAIVCEIDAVTGEFTFVSERAEAFLGYSIARWNEKGFWKEIIHADDYEMAMAALHMEGSPGQGVQYMFRVKSADGAEIWLRNIMRIVRDMDGVVTKRRCVIVDATEQHSASEALALELERNRMIAEAMQYSILWRQPEKSFPGLRVASFYEPAGGDCLVGGDFFDAFRLPDHSLMLMVGDVTGKGLKAAARTVEATFALRAFAQDYRDPGQTIGRLNEFICDFHGDEDDGLGNALIVMSLVVLNPITGEMKVASAGAETPIILRASGNVEEIAIHGLILGIDRGVLYETVQVTLEPGDTLMMTTDGLTEARNGAGFFGYERLLETAQRAGRSGTLMSIGNAILDAAHAYTDGHLSDDICLLLARRDEE